MERDWIKYVLEVVRDEVFALEQFPGFFREFTGEHPGVEDEARPHLELESTPMVLEQFASRLRALPQSTSLVQLQEQVQQLLKQLNKDLKKEAGVSGKAVFMPIRVAITGTVSGQELYYLVPILGIDNVCRRIETALTAGA